VPEIPESVRNAIIAGIILGIVAAGVVWFLERFEVAKLHLEIREYLEASDVVEDLRRKAREKKGEAD